MKFKKLIVSVITALFITCTFMNVTLVNANVKNVTKSVKKQTIKKSKKTIPSSLNQAIDMITKSYGSYSKDYRFAGGYAKNKKTNKLYYHVISAHQKGSCRVTEHFIDMKTGKIFGDLDFNYDDLELYDSHMKKF